MQFSEQSFFSYAGFPFFGKTLSQLFSQADIQPDQFVLSGMEDLKEQLKISHEWNVGHNPKLLLKELVKPGDSTDSEPFDVLYQQYVDGSLRYSRDIRLAVTVKEEPTVYTKSKEGPQRVVNAQFFVGILDLYFNDYWPSAGDLLFWRDITYQIRDARALPSDYYQNTAFPLWIFIDAYPSRQYGDTPEVLGPNMPDQPFTGAPASQGGPSSGPVAAPSESGDDNFIPPAPDIGALVGWKL